MRGRKTQSQSPIWSRRMVLAAAPAFAASPTLAFSRRDDVFETFRFPTRIGYLKFGAGGQVQAGPVDRDAWTGFAVRLGGLIEEVRPLEFGVFFDMEAPPNLDDGASAALTARAAAARQGLDYALVYSVDTTVPEDAPADPDTEYPSRIRRLRGLFKSVAERTAPIEATLGEAHLLSASGGPAIASVWANPTPIRGGLLAKRRATREAEALEMLTERLEQRIRDFATQLYRRNQSIAD